MIRDATGNIRGQDALGPAPIARGATAILCPRFKDVTIRDRGRLPHWEAEGATYFATFHLADALPTRLLESWKAEHEELLKRTRPLSSAEKKRLQVLVSRKVENYLDSGKGACWLGRPEIAQLMSDTLHHFEGRRYRLFTWCVMPNHVHVVFRTIGNNRLAAILHSWKSFTASEANRVLGRLGAFWQREYYDHLIRNEGDFLRIIRYVMNNPVKAGLKDWPWVGVRGQDALDTAGKDASATSKL